MEIVADIRTQNLIVDTYDRTTKTWTLLQTLGVKTNRTSFLCGNRSGHHNTELNVFAKGNQSLFLIRHPSSYSYIQSIPVKVLAVTEERKHLRKKSKIQCHLRYGHFVTVDQIMMTTVELPERLYLTMINYWGYWQQASSIIIHHFFGFLESVLWLQWILFITDISTHRRWYHMLDYFHRRITEAYQCNHY